MSKRGRYRSRAWLRFTACVSLAGLLTVCIASSGAAQNNTRQKSAKTNPFVIISDGLSCNDLSMGQAMCVGGKQAAAATGAKFTFAPNLATADEVSHQAAAYANAGVKYILISEGGVPDVVTALAKQFPNTFFCIGYATIDPPLPKNLCTWNVDFEAGAFNAGVLAGMLTKTNKVAGIESLSFPAINSQLEAFILGARYVNPKVTSVETNINTNTDVSKGEAAANAAIADGADMFISAANETNPGIFKAAEGHPGTLVFPEYVDAHSLAPSVVLTSAIDGTTPCVAMVAKLAAKGTLRNKAYSCGPGISGKLAPFTPQLAHLITPKIRARFNKIQAMLKSGKLKLPTLNQLGQLGQGQKYPLSKLPPAPR